MEKRPERTWGWRIKNAAINTFLVVLGVVFFVLYVVSLLGNPMGFFNRAGY